MIGYERGLYVVIEQLPKGPPPFPMEQGFCKCVAYRVLGICNPSESGIISGVHSGRAQQSGK